MPIISVILAEGRSEKLKRGFIRAVTDATTQALGVRAEQVRIIINETPLGNYAVAGKTFAELDEEASSRAAEETIR